MVGARLDVSEGRFAELSRDLYANANLNLILTLTLITLKRVHPSS